MASNEWNTSDPLEKRYSIRRETEIEVPHEGSTVTFVYDLHGPDSFASVGNSIEQAGLAKPTMPHMASLLYQALNTEEPEFSDIWETMKSKTGLLAYTASLYVPRKGFYFQDNPRISEGLVLMDESELEKRLESHDPTVRFVPYETHNRYPGKYPSRSEYAKDPFMIGLAGKEGAEKLAIVESNRSLLCRIPDPVQGKGTGSDALITRYSLNIWSYPVQYYNSTGTNHEFIILWRSSYLSGVSEILGTKTRGGAFGVRKKGHDKERKPEEDPEYRSPGKKDSQNHEHSDSQRVDRRQDLMDQAAHATRGWGSEGVETARRLLSEARKVCNYVEYD